jgi:cytidyltransferase-like protein
LGGVAKHLMHLYDDRTLTYNKIKKILSAASKGELEGTEKTDGFNLYLGIKNDQGAFAPAWARNKGDMKTGGRSFSDLAAKEFKGGEEVKKVYIDAFKAYEKAVGSLNTKQKVGIFGENGDIFYNTEIQGPGASNVVNYDANIISIHHVNHKRYNPETNDLEIIDTSANSKLLDSLINQFEQATSGEKFSIRRTAFLKLNKLDDDYDLNIALQKIQKAGLSDTMTIEQYLENNIREHVENVLNFLKSEKQQEVIDRILKKEGHHNLTHIYKGFPVEVKQKIKIVVESGPSIIKKATWPIESAIHDFAVELLKGLESAYILNNKEELSRLKNEVEDAIRTIQSYQGEKQEEVHGILAKQLEKLKNHDNITTVVEGFVFQFGDQLYKFTGNFAPVNQLLGLFKYGKGKIPPMEKHEKELDLTEIGTEDPLETVNTIALIPGKFKPPHRGHLDMFKHYSDLADKVIVLISPVARRTPGGIEITAADTVKILQIYFEESDIHNVDVEISEYNSPVQAAIEYGNKEELAGSSVILGASTKGGDVVERFGSNMQKYAPNVNILNPLEFAFKPFGEELHASDFRKALDDPQNDISKYIPEEAKNRISEILNILKSNVNLKEEATQIPLGIFLRLIESHIDEVESEKQRRWACAQLGDKFKGARKLTKKQAKEMCSSKVEEEEDLEEMSSVSGGAIEGGLTKSPFINFDPEKENKKEKIRSKSRPKEEDINKLVREIEDYLLQLTKE